MSCISFDEWTYEGKLFVSQKLNINLAMKIKKWRIKSEVDQFDFWKPNFSRYNGEACVSDQFQIN